MVMKQITLLTLFTVAALFFFGCSSDDRQQPYMMGEKPAEQKRVYSVPVSKTESSVAIASIEAESRKEIARINKERDLELQKMAQSTKLIELRSQNELALKEHNLTSFEKEADYALKKSTLIIIALALTAFLLLGLYIFKKRREDRLKMHRDELEKEMYLREKELQVKMAEKILDTIASGKLSEEREKHLLETFEKATPSITRK